MHLQESTIRPEDIIFLQDEQYHTDNVCIVTGAGTRIGRATCVAAAANNLMTVGIDIDEEEGKKTQRLAREAGGQMIFIRANMEKDEDLEYSVMEAAKLGTIKYLVNIANMRNFNPAVNMTMIDYDRIQRILLRAPLYLSKLTIPYMKRGPEGTGVIGNLAATLNESSIDRPLVDSIAQLGMRLLSQVISGEGEGKIRSFTIGSGTADLSSAESLSPGSSAQNAYGSRETKPDEIIGESYGKAARSPIDVANLFMFIFSRFARYLPGGELLLDSADGWR